MTPEQAIRLTIKNFPFRGYIRQDSANRGVYMSIADTVKRYLRPGSKILDFGSGACDKTLVLKHLGYDC